jgi:hypothetical protein
MNASIVRNYRPTPWSATARAILFHMGLIDVEAAPAITRSMPPRNRVRAAAN